MDLANSVQTLTEREPWQTIAGAQPDPRVGGASGSAVPLSRHHHLLFVSTWTLALPSYYLALRLVAHHGIKRGHVHVR